MSSSLINRFTGLLALASPKTTSEQNADKTPDCPRDAMPQPVSTAATNHPGGGAGACDIPIGIPVAIPVGSHIEECAVASHVLPTDSRSVNGGARVDTLVRCPRQKHQAAMSWQSAPPAGLSDADGRRMIILEKIRNDLRRTARGSDVKGLMAGDGTASANSTKLRMDMERCVRGVGNRQEDEVQLTQESMDTRERAAAVAAASRVGEGEVAGQGATQGPVDPCPADAFIASAAMPNAAALSESSPAPALGAVGGAVVVSPQARGGRIADRRGVSSTTMTAWQTSLLKDELSVWAQLGQMGEEGPKERIGCKDEGRQVQAGARQGTRTEDQLSQVALEALPGPCRVNAGEGTSCTEPGGWRSVEGGRVGQCGKRDRAQALLSLSPDKAGQKGANPWGV